MVATIKHLIVRTAAHAGLELSYRRPRSIAKPPAAPPSVEHAELARTILTFFRQVLPFYDASVPSALQIGGAWRADLLARRPTQLRAIATGDIDAYTALLARLFRSELVTGLWNYHYYASQEIVDPRLHQDLEDLALETGLTTSEIADPMTDFGEWGLGMPNGIIKYTDPMHASQAARILRAIQFVASPRPVVLDLGSGYGGMARYLAERGPRPLTILLVDIPLNLTTAYAYLAHRLRCADVRLVRTLDDPIMSGRPAPLPSVPTRTQILCVPTTLAERATELYPPHLVHNAQSFSEMDADTVSYYLRTLVRPDTRVVIETNAAMPGALNTGNHRELGAKDIECMLADFRVVTRHRTRSTRYVTSTHLRVGTAAS